jgi:uncharacterized short protein YbdD (DUF466 family)
VRRVQKPARLAIGIPDYDNCTPNHMRAANHPAARFRLTRDEVFISTGRLAGALIRQGPLALLLMVAVCGGVLATNRGCRRG